MDGMRKVPDNVPEPGGAARASAAPADLGARPVRHVESFGHHNNAMLRRFLDTFGFEYEFISATEFYRSGQFDAVLLRAAERYDAIMEVMLAAARGAPADLFDLPADPPRDGARALCADQACRRARRHRSPSTTRRGANGRCR
jgi:lysyl-tRNA synthetase class I